MAAGRDFFRAARPHGTGRGRPVGDQLLYVAAGFQPSCFADGYWATIPADGIYQEFAHPSRRHLTERRRRIVTGIEFVVSFAFDSQDNMLDLVARHSE